MSFSLITALLLSAVPALSSPLLEERTGNWCNKDHVLQALIEKGNIDEVIPFCSTYINVPATTVAGSDYCQTTTLTLIIDPLPVIVTEIPTVTVTVTEPSAHETVYSAYTPPAYYKEKRSEPVPAFISEYPASRISSACSCLAIHPSTVTAPCTTGTVIETVSPDPPTITITSTPPATTTTTIPGPPAGTTTLPALCNPDLPDKYKSKLERPGTDDLIQSTETTEQACCLACFDAGDCTYFHFRPDDYNPSEARCEYAIRRGSHH